MRRAACMTTTGSVLLVGLLLVLLASAAEGRHAPVSRGGTDPVAKSAITAEAGEAFEVDRRSHPALAKGWEAILRSDWTDPRLAELPQLKEAQLLHGDADWALLWLDRNQAEALRAAGVRLNAPRSRPSEAMRIGPVAEAQQPAALTVLQSLSAAVNVDQMMTHLNAIATTIQTRFYNTSGMQSATQYALDKFNQYGLDNTYFDTFTYNGYSVRNVVGVKTGTVYPSRIYMICGHLDSTSQQASTLAPGAEDNGSGAVAVLEAARLMAPLTFESTIYFVCFTAEEQGLIGSEHLAAIADAQNWDLRGVLVMDMVGFDTSGSLDIWIEGFPSKPASVSLMNTLESVANTYTDMGVYRYPNNGYGSDHVPFNDHGFPAILAIDYDWDSYSCYHKTCDTVANIVSSQFRRMAVSVLVTGAQLAVPTSGLGSINGVADKTDSTDDSGVRIDVKSTTYPPATSGATGAFTLSDLLPGSYTLRASASGYGTVETAVTVTAGHATAVTIPMNPVAPSRISGTVTLQGGGDPSGTRVFAENQAGYTQAAPSGAYLLEPVEPGQIVVSADHEGYMPASKTVTAPVGGELTGVNFTLKTVWDFESSSEGVVSSSGWEWGSDTVAGAHSGTKVWGTKLSANYANCADYRLDLPPIDLRFYETARLHFWHWYKTESGYDGGNLQISTNGGSTWTIVTPLGGYAGALTGTCNPLSGQQGYVGAKATWTEAVYDLGAYAGSSIRLRFRFGSDSGVVDRGWYIDDLSFEGTLAPVGIVENPSVPMPLLSGFSIAPNPFASSTGVRFDLGAPGAAWATVYDASGRRVRSLIEGAALLAGPQTLAWDGRDDAARSVPAGVYWVRVFAHGRTATGPVALLR